MLHVVMNDKSEVDLTNEDSECTENEHEFILSDAAPDELTKKRISVVRN